jgi:sugar-specific transcriptional regulator TrmB
MKSAVIKLQKLGFSEYEAKAYTALVGDNPLTAYEISKNSGIPSSKIYEVIRKLEYRQMIQSVHGDRSKMFIPLSPDDFVKKFRSSVEENLHAVEGELKDVKTAMDTSYTWHVRDWASLIHKARRMVDTSRKTLMLLAWPDEMEALWGQLSIAEDRGVKIAIIHYGLPTKKVGQVYIHPVRHSIYSDRGVRGFALVTDSHEAINGTIGPDETLAIWSMNEAFVIMAEDYIRHDIYWVKTMKRLDPLMREKFGARYEKLRDIFSDETP